jgi:tetratricopeptide (TPR) repeat protein
LKLRSAAILIIPFISRLQPYLYHFNDLAAALQAFEKAAKYARPGDSRQCSESHYFAGVVCALMHRFDDAVANFLEAGAINPNLFDAHYQCAVIAAIKGSSALATRELKAPSMGTHGISTARVWNRPSMR